MGQGKRNRTATTEIGDLNRISRKTWVMNYWVWPFKSFGKVQSGLAETGKVRWWSGSRICFHKQGEKKPTWIFIFNSRVTTNKLLLSIIIILELAILGGVVYLKFFHKKWAFMTKMSFSTDEDQDEPSAPFDCLRVELSHKTAHSAETVLTLDREWE